MKKPNGYWQSKVNCRQVAKKCKSKSELFKKYPSAYFACLKNNWIDEFYPNSETKRGRKFWTKENCRVEAQKYSSVSDFSRGNGRAYRVSLDNGWLDEFGFATRQSTDFNRKKKIWTKEECAEIARTCNTRKEFCKKKASAFRASEANGWLDEFFGIKNLETKERYRQQASRYKTSSAFKKYAVESYKYCLFRGWIDEFYPGEVKPVEELPNGIKYKTVRKMMLDYVEVNGPQTRDEMRKVMLTICGQNIDDKKWGVGYWNNVSFGTSVFLPARKDKRYLKPIRTFDCSEVKYDIAIAEV